MISQHIVTQPVFEAMFENYNFAKHNPVSTALNTLLNEFEKYGLEAEIRDLSSFYNSVRQRVKGLNSSSAKQQVLMELYEKFFKNALAKHAERLGIVYTPTEIVDFILNSAENILRTEFNCGLTDENVHVLDPFAGTGIFLTRLLQSHLILDVDLDRKFELELHANEIMLLAYYIASIQTESAYHGRKKTPTDYRPFPGIVLSDTFNLLSKRQLELSSKWLSENRTRAKRQQETPIKVIIGNPPWSAGQKSVDDKNPNFVYPELEKLISETFVKRSKATSKNKMYDSYKMALLWASERIEDKGIVAFVTNGSWIDGKADAGTRAYLSEIFDSIYVFNLRGNTRTSGERCKKEGGKVFGQGSRATVAITVLVKNSNESKQGCRIYYRDIGDYLSRKQKLSIIEEIGCISKDENWAEITPDKHNDWIKQRNPDYHLLYPVASMAVKSGKSNDSIFQLFSNGYKTARDAYLYNFSDSGCAHNAKLLISDYKNAIKAMHDDKLSSDVEEITNMFSKHARWDRELTNHLKRGKRTSFNKDRIWATCYRPFIKQYNYVDYLLANCKYQMDLIYPDRETSNPAINILQPAGAFSAIITEQMPDRGMAVQCLPRYRYESTVMFLHEKSKQRVDNITDVALNTFRSKCGDNSISKDDIFYYVYGVFHSQHYLERYENALDKELPRVPIPSHNKLFRTYSTQGRNLAKLHLEYETCNAFNLKEVTNLASLENERYKLGKKKMRFTDKENRSELIINDHCSLTGIPSDAHEYKVHGRTPLEWFIYQYHVSIDEYKGIINDANEWFDSPKDLISAIKRIVHVSVETTRIIKSLPDPFE